MKFYFKRVEFLNVIVVIQMLESDVLYKMDIIDFIVVLEVL